MFSLFLGFKVMVQMRNSRQTHHPTNRQRKSIRSLHSQIIRPKSPSRPQHWTFPMKDQAGRESTKSLPVRAARAGSTWTRTVILLKILTLLAAVQIAMRVRPIASQKRWTTCAPSPSPSIRTPTNCGKICTFLMATTPHSSGI